MQKKAISTVLWYTKTNRLARNTSDLLKIVEDLHKQNVEFFSLSERMEVNTSFSGKLMLADTCEFLEFERTTLSRTYLWSNEIPKNNIIKAIYPPGL